MEILRGLGGQVQVGAQKQVDNNGKGNCCDLKNKSAVLKKDGEQLKYAAIEIVPGARKILEEVTLTE